jgi:phage-related protein
MSTDVYYYTTSGGENPFARFLDSLEKSAAAKVLRLISAINVYGLLSILPHTKKLTGTPLWEIRILGKDNIRVIYVTKHDRAIIVLHGFIKKTQVTPHREIAVAMKRYADMQHLLDS